MSNFKYRNAAMLCAAGVATYGVVNSDKLTRDHVRQALENEVENQRRVLSSTANVIVGGLCVPVDACRRLQNWWTNRSAERRAERSARQLEDAIRDEDRYDPLEEFEREVSSNNAQYRCGTDTSGKQMKHFATRFCDKRTGAGRSDMLPLGSNIDSDELSPPLEDCVDNTSNQMVVHGAPFMRRGERRCELSAEARIQFGMLPNSPANREIVRRFLSRSKLLVESSVRNVHRVPLLEAAVADYFMVRASDLVYLKMINGTRNTRRIKQLNAARA